MIQFFKKRLLPLFVYASAALLTLSALTGGALNVVAPNVALAEHDVTVFAPADTMLFVHVDLKALRAAPGFKAIRDAILSAPEFDMVVKEASAFVGFDVIEKLDAVTVQFREDMPGNPHDRLLITASGPDVQEVSIVAAINKKIPSGSPIVPVAGKPARYVAEEGSRECIGFAGNVTRLGTTSEVDESMDAPKSDPAWTAKLKAALVSPAFVLVRVPVDVQKELLGLQELHVAIRASDALEMDVVATFADEKSATAAKEVAWAGLVELSGKDAALTKSLGLSDIKFNLEGANIKTSIKLTPEQIKLVYMLIR